MPDQPKKWRYPAQREIYFQNPAMQDYENILGNSMLNYDIEDWLENTSGAVLSPEQRAAFEEEWRELPMGEKMAGPPGPYMSTPGLRPGEVSITGEWGIAAVEHALEKELMRLNPNVAHELPPPPRQEDFPRPPDFYGISPREFGPRPVPPPLKKGGPGGVGRKRGRAGMETDAATPPTPPSKGGEEYGTVDVGPDGLNCAGCADGESPKRRRTPRCTKKEHHRRKELVAQWLLEGRSNDYVYRAFKQLFGVGRRMAQVYIKKVKALWADEAGAEDFQAHLWKSKLMRERLLQRGFKDLDKIEDPTKSPTMLRTLDNLIKHNDETMEQIRHHRVVTRRDTSPDSKKAKMMRGKMIYMPFDELLERAENMRNRWFHEWNLLRLAEKEREGTLGPGHIDSPYVAALKDPKFKMEPRLGPPGTDYCI